MKPTAAEQRAGGRRLLALLDRDGRGLGCRPGRALRGIALELSLTGLSEAERTRRLAWIRDDRLRRAGRVPPGLWVRDALASDRLARCHDVARDRARAAGTVHDRVSGAGTALDRVGAAGTAWLPVSVDEFPQRRHVGWFWPADGQKDVGSLQLYLFAGLGKRADPVLTRVSDGRMLAVAGCAGQPVAQYVIWIWTNPGLGTVGYYSDFLGWLTLTCADAVLFQKQMKYGFSSGVQGPFGPQGYVV